jgi:hypothetical protein
LNPEARLARDFLARRLYLSKSEVESRAMLAYLRTFQAGELPREHLPVPLAGPGKTRMERPAMEWHKLQNVRKEPGGGPIIGEIWGPSPGEHCCVLVTNPSGSVVRAYMFPDADQATAWIRGEAGRL